MPDAPLILLDPHPRARADIFDAAAWARLQSLGRVVAHDGEGPMPAAQVEANLAEVELILGQTDLPAEWLGRATKLRGVINVETNFLPNIDYGWCFDHGVHVLTPGSAFAPAVAETALAMAIDLARGITAADRDFRAGREGWGLEGNAGCFTFAGAAVGVIGFGDLGRALHRLIAPFGCPVKAYDPWLPDYFLLAQGVQPAALDEVLSTSKVIFVFAGVSSDNAHFIAKPQFERIQPGSAFLLLSRAAVVDFPEMLAQAASGRLKVATDVFPVEPVGAGDPMRANPGLLLSAHRAGAMTEALFDIGAQAVADAEMILRGLAPVVCRKAQRETVGRSRSKPIEKS